MDKSKSRDLPQADDIAQALRELSRGEQAATTLENRLPTFNQKLDELLASLETAKQQDPTAVEHIPVVEPPVTDQAPAAKEDPAKENPAKEHPAKENPAKETPANGEGDNRKTDGHHPAGVS